MIGHAEIAGAGFAGLAAAAALALRGWSVCVHEAADEPRSDGAGIYVHNFAQDVLRRIGAFTAFDEVAFTPVRRETSVDGVSRSTVDTRGLFRTTTRYALHRAVLDAAVSAGARIAVRSRAVGADPTGALLLESGERRPADLVVAADGVRAEVAKHVGLASLRLLHKDGITRVLLDRTGMRSPDWDKIIDSFDYRIRPLRILYSPCGPDVFYLCLMAPARDAQACAVPIDSALWARSFPLLAPALDRVGPAGRHDRYTTTVMPRWWSGRVAVIGDAAHAMPSSLGQGAGVSMLNAVEMADIVSASHVLENGLAAWEVTLRPVVEQWQREAESLAEQRSLDGKVHPGHDLLVARTKAFPHLRELQTDCSPAG